MDAGLSIRQANVEAFLDAAERLLIREGAAGISTRQLAREAGQNHGLVHYYFGSVDELLLQALERFTGRILERQRAMYGTDAPFIEKWRTAMGFIEEDLASGYPKVWGELQTLAWNKPELRERLQSLNDSWRSLLRDALCEAIEEYDLKDTGFSAEAWAALVMQFNEGLLTRAPARLRPRPFRAARGSRELAHLAAAAQEDKNMNTSTTAPPARPNASPSCSSETPGLARRAR